MFGISRETVERLRKEYPVGCRVELVRMDDPQAPAIGTKGTVRGVDDIGSGRGAAFRRAFSCRGFGKRAAQAAHQHNQGEDQGKFLHTISPFSIVERLFPGSRPVPTK